jgi:anti-anti-sigma regulatory factor
MSTKGNKKAKSYTLNLSPNFTIDITPQVFDELKSMDNKKASLTVQSETIESIDLSGIQLLLLIKQESEKFKASKFDISFSDNVGDIINKCGFSELLQI